MTADTHPEKLLWLAKRIATSHLATVDFSAVTEDEECAALSSEEQKAIHDLICGAKVVTSHRPYRPEGYTEEDQRSDTSFLVGAAYGRDTERARLTAEVRGVFTRLAQKLDSSVAAGSPGGAVRRTLQELFDPDKNS